MPWRRAGKSNPHDCTLASVGQRAVAYSARADFEAGPFSSSMDDAIGEIWHMVGTQLAQRVSPEGISPQEEVGPDGFPRLG